MKPRIKAGFIGLGLYAGALIATYGWLFYSAATNPADSGEGGVLLLIFALPWLLISLPYYPAVALNLLLAFLLPYALVRAFQKRT